MSTEDARRPTIHDHRMPGPELGTLNVYQRDGDLVLTTPREPAQTIRSSMYIALEDAR